MNQNADTILKVEGPTDLLAVLPLLPPGVFAFTNANGSGENPPAWVVALGQGKRVLVCHDADAPGRSGQEKWAAAFARTATESHGVFLPYPLEKDRGKDLRDYVGEGHTWEDFCKLPTVKAEASDGEKPNEAEDDPHRLARVNLKRYSDLTAGGRIVYWREEWWRWKPEDRCYRRIGEKEFRSKIGWAIKQEFDRLNLDAIRRGVTENDQSPQARKVTAGLVTNVQQALSTMCLLSSSVELNTWLPDGQTKNWIALGNGILDVDAMLDAAINETDAEVDDVMRQHSPDWFSPSYLGYDFDPEAECPRFMRYLERTLEGDQDRISILQEWAGYCLLPDTSHQSFLVLEGNGKNGKSVYAAVIQALVGRQNCSFVGLEKFGDRFSLGFTVGKLVNIVGDVNEVDKVAEGHLKSFSGGEPITQDRKGISALEFCPTARLMFCANTRPQFRDRSSGIWRRMICVPFRVEITQSERILGMDTAAWWEQSKELPGIFRWALAGLIRLRLQKEFSYSKLVAETIEDYRVEANPAREFLKDFLEPHLDTEIRTSQVYGLYKHWCEKHGYKHPYGERMFGKEVKRMFPKVDHVRSSKDGRPWLYRGIRFTVEEVCGMKAYDEKLF